LEATQSESVSFLKQLIGPLAFSLAFASPFFALALFPTLLKAMPRSGSWMNSVKVVMGFLELAAAIKFLRAAELGWFHTSDWFTYDLTLGVYVALCLACGLYLLSVYRLPHDHEAPETIGVPRLLFSLVFLALGLYLLPGLFKQDDGESQKPRGVISRWVRSFLLPEANLASAHTSSTPNKDGRPDRLVWLVNYPEALKQAAAQNKPLFIDFTGEQCTNCKLNEDRFTEPAIKAQFSNFVLVQLYTDDIPKGLPQVPSAAESLQLRDHFGNRALPFYVIGRVNGDKVEKITTYKRGLIKSPEEFAGFLSGALGAYKQGKVLADVE
jgi:thiol:disulfide interchange protein